MRRREVKQGPTPKRLDGRMFLEHRARRPVNSQPKTAALRNAAVPAASSGRVSRREPPTGGIFAGMVVFMLAPLAALGVERFPPPEFEPRYVMPLTTAPAPRADWLAWLDVAVLAITLGLAAWFVLKKRSRPMILGLGIFSLAYFGFYRKGCVCAIGSIQDVSLSLFNHGVALPLTIAAFFLLPIIFALFFGRVFCAGVCPQGALQDLVLIKPVQLPFWLERVLRVIPFLYLGAAVLFAATGGPFLICEWDPFVALFRRYGATTMLALGGGFLLVGAFVGRPYCRFLCPYGAILSVFSRVSKWRVRLAPEDCIQCGICDNACPYGAIEEPVPAGVEKVNKTVDAGWAIAAGVGLVMIVGGIVLGGNLSEALSRGNPTVSLANRITQEESGRFKDTTEASQAYRQTARPLQELYDQATQVRAQFAVGGRWLGGFVGLAFGATLFSLVIRRPAAIYDPDRADCVACGRCYRYCPKELSRVKRASRKPVPAPKPA